jgi:CBS domain containing-hemolysin-like protein
MKVSELLGRMNSNDTQAYVVVNEEGKILGSITKTHMMTKLVKNSVTLDTPIVDMVIRDIRHVSSTTKLNELARVLARTRYALVDKKSLITVDDYVAFLGSKLEVKAQKTEKAEEVYEPENKIGYITLAAASIAAAGLATGAFFLAKRQ